MMMMTKGTMNMVQKWIEENEISVNPSQWDE
jgi:hypothetical protein